jgi:hypoxanthine phosphoribosyltransferase
MELLISHQILQIHAKRVASEINNTKEYKDGIVCLVVLKGGVPWSKDLLSYVTHPITIHYIQTFSYHGAIESSQYVDIDMHGLKDKDIKGKHVIVIDDVYDSGRTFNIIDNNLRHRKPLSLVYSVAVFKQNPKAVGYPEVYPTLIGAVTENDFLVGYGMDYDEKYRNLRGIYKWMKNDSIRLKH